MLKWIFSRQKAEEETTGHPLGGESAIDATLAAIPTSDPVQCVREINDWLNESDALVNVLDPAQFVRAVDRLDDFVQEAVAELWKSVWVEMARTQGGNPPTYVLDLYYGYASTANRRALEVAISTPALAADKRVAARHALRLMHGWSQKKKLARMTYRDPGKTCWHSAHELIQRCHELDIVNLPQNAYGISPAQTTVWKEYMAGLLFETAPLSSIAPNEMELVDRVTRFVEPRAHFSVEALPESIFCIDLDNENGPARYRPGMPGGGQRRYFGPGSGREQLLELRDSLVSDRRLPAWLESSACQMSQTKRLLSTLAQHWSDTPPTRSQPRRRMSGNLLVTYSMEVIRRMVAASDFAHSRRNLDYEGYLKTMTARHRGHAAITAEAAPQQRTCMETLQVLEAEGARQMMEHWELMDVSPQGMGCRMPVRKPWLNIGALVGYRFEEELDWHVGIVKRIGVSHGRANAGLATFSGTPMCSQLRPANPKEESPWANQTKETSGLGWRDAIVLSEDPGLLVAPRGTFNADSRLEMSISGRFRPIRLLSVVAHGSDYEIISYSE